VANERIPDCKSGVFCSRVRAHPFHGASINNDRAFRQNSLIEIFAAPYVPGIAQGSISRNAEQAGAILIVSELTLATGSQASGFIVVEGAMFSHAMLGLLAKGIPAVIVTSEQAASLHEGQLVQLDGYKGSIRSLPVATGALPQSPAVPRPGQPVMSADGVAVALRASVRSVTGAKQAKTLGAESIGLVRTEFLEPDPIKLPDSFFYQQAFAELIEEADPLKVTFRLLDVATDKLPGWVSGTRRFLGPLGRQGIRLFDDENLREVVSAQIDAVVQIGMRERVKLLVPYVSTVEEMQRVKGWIQGRAVLPVGTMLETPAAAMDIAAQLEVADFAALGTNDLMQCFFGADRDDPTLRHYLNPYSPQLYRFLARVAGDAGEKLPLVQVCGLLSQLPGVLPVMLGLGFRAFSVDAAYIPFLAATVRQTHVGEARSLAEEVCRMKTETAVGSLLGARVDKQVG